jgi:ABC transporter substrate binding protein
MEFLRRRREFVTLLGGAAAMWPLAARAQQPERMRRIGVLAGGAVASDADTQERNAVFAKSLQELGWVVGRNLRIDFRYGLGDAANVRKYVEELVALAPDVVLVSGASALAPLLQATRTVPIVFVAVADPVGAGFVESMARPGGNATGFIQFEYSLSGKWLELLKEIAPGVTQAAVAGSRHHGGSRPIRRHTVRGIVDRARRAPSQRARCRGDRARRDGYSALAECWAGRHGKRIVADSQRADHHTGGAAQIAGGLSAAIFRRRRRADLLWI